MIVASYYRPTPNTSLKSAALAPMGFGALDAGLYGNDAWQLVLTSQNLYQTGANVTSGTSPYGYFSACADSASGAWAVQQSGALVHMPQPGAFTAYNASGQAPVWMGNAYAQTLATAYALASGGQIYAPSGSALVELSPAFGTAMVRGLSVSGSTLFTADAVSGNLGYLSLTASGTGTSGQSATPMPFPTCLAASSGTVAVGGYQYASFASGYSALTIGGDLQSIMVGVVSGTGTAGLYLLGANPGTWTQNSAASGLGSSSNITWVPGGSQLLTADAVAGNIYVLTYSLGSLSVSGSLAVSGAGQIAAPSATSALVCQPSLNTVQPLTATASGVWSASGAALAINQPKSICSYGSSGAIVGCASGLAFLTESASGVWSVTATGSVGFTPSSLFVDAYSLIYAAATSGASGYYAIVSGTSTIVGSGTFAGSGSAIVALQGQTTVADGANNLLRTFGPGPNGYAQQTSGAAPTGVSSFALGALINGYQDLFVGGATQTWQYNYTAPYTPARTRQGMLSAYAGGSWSSYTLNIGCIPEALAWDASGNIWSAIYGNFLFSFTSGLALLSSGTVMQFPGQIQSTPNGISALAWSQGQLFGASSMNDSLVLLVASGASGYILTDDSGNVLTDGSGNILTWG